MSHTETDNDYDERLEQKLQEYSNEALARAVKLNNLAILVDRYYIENLDTQDIRLISKISCLLVAEAHRILEDERKKYQWLQQHGPPGVHQ